MSNFTVYFKNGNKTVFENFSDFLIYRYSITNKGMISFLYVEKTSGYKACANLRTDTIRYYLVSDLKSVIPASDDVVNALIEPPIMEVHLANMSENNEDLQVYFQDGSMKTFKDLQLYGYNTGSITDKDALLFTYNKGTCLGNIYLDEVNYASEVQKD